MNIKPAFYSYSKKSSKLSKAERKKAAISEAKWILKSTNSIKGVNSKQIQASIKGLNDYDLEQLSKAIKVMERSLKLKQKQKIQIKRVGNEAYIAKIKPERVRISGSKHVKNEEYSLVNLNCCYSANVTKLNFGPIRPEPPRPIGREASVKKK